MSADGRQQLGDGGELQIGEYSPLIVAAHELKAPLALIRQLSLSLADVDLLPAEQTEIIEHIRQTSERAIRLTSDLTRSQRLQPPLFELEPVDCQQMCQAVAKEMAPLYQASQRQFRVARRKKPLLAVANKELLQRVLLNFAGNAIYHTDDRAAIEISASAREGGETIRFSVRDFGPSVAKNIFSSLSGDGLLRPEQLNARPESSGLGLLISRQFAEFMNGSIGMIRHRDGATFYVDIKASKQLNLL